MVPTTVKDFVILKLAELPLAARLVVIFDPFADLALGETWEIDTATIKTPVRTWRVLLYDGNDLAFRQRQNKQSGQSDLIWVTLPPGVERDTPLRIKLQSMMDVWQRAEAFIDASLPGVLRQLAPSETWPEAPIWEHANILSQNLPAVINGLRELRPHLQYPFSLDRHLIRTLALHALQPSIPVERLLFRVDTPARVLNSYLELLWQTDWPVQGLTLLQKHALEAPRFSLPNEVETWLNTPPVSLALYLYLRHFLGHFHVQNIANQLRGLGFFDLDTVTLEAHVGGVLEWWGRNLAWRNEVIRQAESVLSLDDINKAVNLLNLNTPAAVSEALVYADTPATLYAFQVKFFELAFNTREAHKHTPEWVERRPRNLGNLPNTPFKEYVITLTRLLTEVSFIDARLPLTSPKQADVARLLEWYIEHKLYDLEYAHARATNYLLYLENEKMRHLFEQYLKWQKGMIKEFLNNLDHTLAKLITDNWSGYLSHPRLSINVLSDMIRSRRLKPSTQTRLWIVVFDGMRWDTWANHVKPRLLETFEFVEPEKAYMSLLPSWTMVARTGLLAGRLPGDWKSYQHKFIRDQAQLAARLFSLPQGEYRSQLQFFSNMESDRKYSQVRGDSRYPYNILIYNISDDNLHSQRGSLSELNKVVNTLLDSILQSLKNLVEPDDILVISSDHGFIELDEADAITVSDDKRWERIMAREAHPVRYRYLTTHEIPHNLAHFYKVNYSGLNDKYTVAVGRHWFRRADNRGPEDRYAHGGLSLAEMVVPGAILKRITEKRVAPTLQAHPTKLEMQEKETQEFRLTVNNKGNVPLEGQLTVQTNLTDAPALYPINLSPSEEREVVYTVKAEYRTRSDGQVDSTEAVMIALIYKDLNGQEKRINKRVPVTVTPRTDVVELDFGGLSDLDI